MLHLKALVLDIYFAPLNAASGPKWRNSVLMVAGIGKQAHTEDMVNFDYKGNCFRAHRMAWMLTYGPIPAKLHVLHDCDNASCCNPKHLFLGIQKDNMHDMYGKKRNNQVCGEKHRLAKLTNDQVIKIKNSLIKGITQAKLAKKYDVTRHAIGKINTGRSWAHI